MPSPVSAAASVRFCRQQCDAETAVHDRRRPGRPISGSRSATVEAYQLLTWGAPERCQTRVILAAIGGLLPPPPPGAAGPFALSVPGKLEELAKAAGLDPDHADDVPTPPKFQKLREGVCSDLALRVGEDASYIPAELDVTGMTDLPRSGIGRQLSEGGPERCHWLLRLRRCR